MNRFRNFFRFRNKRFFGRIHAANYQQFRPQTLIPPSLIASAAFAAAVKLGYPVKGLGEDEELESKLSRRQQRFREFASVEYCGSEYMTPQDFLDCLILDAPRDRVFRRVLTPDVVQKMLKRTPPLRKGSHTMFRDLGQDGLISYAEYVFIITLLTKSQQSFNIAFIMFDDDDNMRIDKDEFLKIRSLMLSLRGDRCPIEDNDCELSISDFMVPAKGVELNRMADYVPQIPELSARQDTTIVAHLFGLSGRDSLSFDQFQVFYKNLQKELIEIEFQEFSRGKQEISAVDFARLVLRYSVVEKDDHSPYIRRVYDRSPVYEKGVSLAQFEQFSMFLNNLEDFTIAVKLYTAAELPVSKLEFIRAVKCSTGFELDPYVVEILYRIFDANNDDRLSYSEFIAIMNDRLHRGFRSHTKQNRVGWELFKDCVISELSLV